MESKTYLITVELFDSDSRIYYVRNLIQTETVNQEDVEFYYNHLLGFDGYRVAVYNREVPDTFTLGLLGSGYSDVPKHYPVYDIQFDSGDSLKRYYKLVNQVCEMEEMRQECGVSNKVSMASSDVSNNTTSKKEVFIGNKEKNLRSWISEVLNSINASTDDLWRVPEDINSVEDKDTIAWILTPMLEEIRLRKGSRILTDTTLGLKWGTLLGSELYPDIMVSRRLSIIQWRIQTSRSLTLAQMAIEWYLDSQSKDMKSSGIDGLSPWIVKAERELAMVLVPFQNVGPERPFVPLKREDVGIYESDEEDDAPGNVHVGTVWNHLKTIEQTYLISKLSNPNTMEIEYTLWLKFVNIILRHKGITTDIINQNEKRINRSVAGWIRAKFGVDPVGPPIFPDWKPVWDILMYGASEEKIKERFELFVDTVTIYDPINQHIMTNFEKYALTNRWIRLFVDLETVYEPDKKVKMRVLPLYALIRKWVLQYIPFEIANNPLLAVNICPRLTELNYRIVKYKVGGRHIHNMRLRRLTFNEVEEKEVPEEPEEEEKRGARLPHLPPLEPDAPTAEPSRPTFVPNSLFAHVSEPAPAPAPAPSSNSKPLWSPKPFVNAVCTDEVHLGSM